MYRNPFKKPIGNRKLKILVLTIWIMPLVFFNSCGILKSPESVNSPNNSSLLDNSLLDSLAPPFEVADGIRAAAKSKYLLSGGALDQEEVQELIALGADVKKFEETLGELTEKWTKDQTKLIHFLSIALQQDVRNLDRDGEQVIGDVTLGNLDTARGAIINLEEMMPRTALYLMEEEKRSFTEIATTQRWMVTTATLVLMAWMDNRRTQQGENLNQNRNRFRDFFRSTMTAEDFNDWRLIEFAASGNNTSAPAFDQVAAYRALRHGDRVSFGIPRVGFFSSPAFLAKWPTNQENQFRVTTSQALLAGLNEPFDAADPTTAALPLAASDTAHSQPGTSCFQCHRLMDPMRNVFANIYTTVGYRYRSPASEPSGFAFQGVTREMSDLASFGQIIASHPKFVSGWAQKICSYFNSQTCSEDDPEFAMIVAEARVGSFDLIKMYRRFASSPIVTGHATTSMYREKPFLISSARENHLCHAINVRTNHLRKKMGVSAWAEDQQFCAHRNATLPKVIFARDEVARGDAGFVQPTAQSAFRTRAAERFCSDLGDFLSPATTVGFLPSETESDREESLNAIAEIFLGYPPAHESHLKIKAALASLWDYSFENATARQIERRHRFALARVIEFACMMPEIQAMGF